MANKELFINTCMSCLDELGGVQLLSIKEKKQSLSIVGNLINDDLLTVQNSMSNSDAVIKQAVNRFDIAQALCKQSEFTNIDRTINKVNRYLELGLSSLID